MEVLVLIDSSILQEIIKSCNTTDILLDAWVPSFKQDEKDLCPHDAAYIQVKDRKSR